MAGLRVGWRMKAVLPVAGILLTGLLVFLWVTLSFQGPERHRVLTVAAAGAVAICAALLSVLAVLIQRPLVELQEKIARIRDGDLKVTVGFADRNDEIGDLGRNFNAMVRQLRETHEEIQKLHRTQMSRAEHLATLGELAAGLAHEIRNPLAGIAGVIEVIGRDLPAGSPSREILKDVQQEVLHIQKILSDLLDYARPRPPDFHSSDLNATAEQAINLARQQAASRGIPIEMHRGEGLAAVEHDAPQIRQVLLNLLLNAIQAIEGAGWIRVKLEACEGLAVIRVADNGRGIAPDHLASIFRPFFTTKGHGTGLGLSLARRIVESHGGRIEVASVARQGSEFVVWLPLRRTPSEAASS